MCVLVRRLGLGELRKAVVRLGKDWLGEAVKLRYVMTSYGWLRFGG